MRNPARMIALLFTIPIAQLIVSGCATAVPAQSQATKPGSGRQDVELTIYQADFAMVREKRPVSLEQGVNLLALTDVSRQLDPESPMFTWVGTGTPPKITSQSYDLGAEDGAALKKKYSGQEVEVVNYGQDGKPAETLKGRLVVENGSTVVQANGKFYFDPPGTVVAPVNPNIVTLPQLSVQAEAAAQQAATLDIAYLTRGFSWSADYVLQLAPNASTAALECWATVLNQTGVDYPSAKLSLVTGSPNRATKDAETRQLLKEMKPMKDGAFLGGRGDWDSNARARRVAAPESMGESYTYSIKATTSVVQDRMNRILMFDARKLPLIKDYNTSLPAITVWNEGYSAQTPAVRSKFALSLNFKNDKAGGLALPMPGGNVRVYEPDKSGSLRYVGASSMENTTTDQKVNLTMSESFDLYSEWRTVKVQRVDKRTVQKQIEVVLHNEKAQPVDMRLVQPVYGKWKIVSSSSKPIAINSQMLQWTIGVPAGGAVTLRYVIQVSE